MSSAVATVTPFHDSSRKHRLIKVGCWLVGLLLLAVVLRLLGVDVIGWLQDVWTQIKDVPIQYPGKVQLWQVITAYAVGVSMNNFLPANIGTFVTLLMFLAIIPGSTFPGILAAYFVNKIFFTIVGGLVYLWLFLQAGQAFDVELGWFRDHGPLGLLLFLGGVVLVAILVRIFWRWLKKLWEKAKQGGKILSDPKAFATRVLLPQLGSYAAKVGVIIVFLAAYSIPVTFHSVMSVIGSSSAANMASVTPGAVGITQAANVVALQDYTSADTATAYSLSQQLITTVVNLGYALVLVILIFGWTGGKLLVSQSYADAKVKSKEMTAKKNRGKGKDDSPASEDPTDGAA